MEALSLECDLEWEAGTLDSKSLSEDGGVKKGEREKFLCPV